MASTKQMQEKARIAKRIAQGKPATKQAKQEQMSEGEFKDFLKTIKALVKSNPDVQVFVVGV